MKPRWSGLIIFRNKIFTTMIILLLLSVLFSGCIGEKNIAPAPDSTKKEPVDVLSPNLTQSSKEENIPEIKITSFSSVYLHDNSNNEVIYLSWETVPDESNRLLSYLKNDLHIEWVTNAQIIRDDLNKTIRVFTNERSIEIVPYDKIYRTKYDISERYYAAYNLSIKNNGSNPIDFKMNDLRLHEGDRIFNITTLEHYDGPSSIEVLHELKNENKLQDTILLPGQTVNGTVTFRVNSLYNESFLLIYNTTPVTSASFEKSLKALWNAEHFKYSMALGVPPYRNCYELSGMNGSYFPIFNDLCDTWANWLNRTIFETFQKSDLERMQKSPDNMQPIEMVYALRVIPERNITMYPVTTTTNLVVIDDKGEELINTSRIAGMAVMSNLTYIFKPEGNLNFPGMNLSNASIVQISFFGRYSSSGRTSINNQDLIMDDKLNVIVVRNYPRHYIS